MPSTRFGLIFAFFSSAPDGAVKEALHGARHREGDLARCPRAHLPVEAQHDERDVIAIHIDADGEAPVGIDDELASPAALARRAACPASMMRSSCSRRRVMFAMDGAVRPVMSARSERVIGPVHADGVQRHALVVIARALQVRAGQLRSVTAPQLPGARRVLNHRCVCMPSVASPSTRHCLRSPRARVHRAGLRAPRAPVGRCIGRCSSSAPPPRHTD